MACFLVAATVGAVTTILRNRFPERWHINWLNTMIFGATVALGVDHIASGEIIPWPPFLTAMNSPTGIATMIGEMATIGIPMTIALISTWVAMVIFYEKLIAAKTAPTGAPDT